ncbi:MFS transporter [Bacillus suaedae]|uniref:MFS transporter n=1 Tax=Halalkalibacter suaedae TaxID=2822140 RepID=A0A940WSA6_9BACI|nr:MFS transporter [Bacillus suaedae]MBP3951799.1 MFS transporter [Bacillus suaedae]
MEGKHTYNYYLILSAIGIAAFGEWLYRLALPIIVLEMTKSASLTALMYILEFIPFIILGPMAGAIADRIDRKKLVVSMQVIASILAGLLVYVLQQQWVNYWILFVFGFLLSCTQAFFYPALQGLIQTLIPKGLLTKVNSRKRSIESVFSAVGPALGGVSIALMGIYGAIIINSTTFLIAALILIFLTSQKINLAGNVKDVLKTNSMFVESIMYLRANKALLAGVLLFGGVNFGLMALQSNLIYIITIIFGLSNVITGIVIGAGGFGAIIGALIAPMIHQKLKTGHMIVYSMFATGVFMCFMIFESWIALALFLALANAAVSNIVVPWMSYQQSIVPVTMIGRVTSIGRMLSFIAIPLGAFVGGFLLENYNQLWPISVVAGGSIICMAIIARITALWSAEFNDDETVINPQKELS